MKAIIITSSQQYSGKSTFSVGIAAVLKERGLSVGYMKPVGCYPIKAGNIRVDEDACFAREALGLKDDIGDISPLVLTWETRNKYLAKKSSVPRKKVAGCYEKISAGKDIVLIEGAQNFVDGKLFGLSALELSALFDAGIVLLDTYSDDLSVDRVLAGCDYFGERYLGVILNWVPESRRKFVDTRLKEYFLKESIGYYGEVYIDKVLRSISVGDLAEGLGGEIISALNKSEELVESMMIGAMGQEHSLQLFRKRPNKVVVTGGDRADIQLAALETSTRALVLTGGHKPSPLVLGQAEEMGVPIIMVRCDTATTAELVDDAIGKQRFHNRKKIDTIKQIVRDNIDLDLLLENAGI
ncbi:MAG: phosphotransacetylase family protein [Actinobacteria bacterium]|nr:phosphotransacetylase family protein [Actinomycetota bacterium]